MSIAYAHAYRPSAVTLPSFILLRAFSLFIVHRLSRAVRLPCSYFFVCSRALTRCGSNSPKCQIASYVNNFIWKFQLLYCKETAQNSCEITTTAESPLQWRIQGGIPGSHGSPLSAQLSSRSVCTMRNFSLDGSPYLMNSKIILTIAHLQVFLNEFWSIACPRAQ